MRFVLVLATIAMLTGCATRRKGGEVMIDTRKQGAQHVNPNQVKSEAWKLGDPTLSGREYDEHSDDASSGENQ